MELSRLSAKKRGGAAAFPESRSRRYSQDAYVKWTLSRRHVAATLTSTPSIFTAGRTILLPSKGPELGGYSDHTCSWLMSSLFTAPKVAAAAFVRVRRLGDPSEFSAGLFNAGRSTQS